MPVVEVIRCCSNRCISHDLPNVEMRQQMRDEYFSYKSDCDCKQWLKDTFLFGFIDEDDVEVKQFHYLECKLCWNAIKRLTGCSGSYEGNQSCTGFFYDFLTISNWDWCSS